MERSDRLSLSYVMAAQSQKHVTVNETTRALDALVHMSVVSRSETDEPGTPTVGQGYILPNGATGANWDAYTEDQVVVFQDNAWMVYPPVIGMTIYVEDESAHVVWTGSGWQVTASGGGNPTETAEFGINTTADTTNKLAVKSDAVLHSHDDVTPGSGDVRHVLNKAADTNTASHLFQTGYSGRAEFGLTGTDDFTIKVSPDGSTFFDAIVIDRTTGAVSFPNTPDLTTGGGNPPSGPTLVSPDEIADLVGWYDPSDTDNITLSAGRVATLADKSNAGSNATQGTTAQQPTLTTASFGGREALSFTGAEYLTIPGLAAVFSGDDKAFSIHCAFQGSQTGRVLFAASRSTASAPVLWLGLHTTNEFRVLRRADDNGFQIVDFAQTDTSDHVLSFIFTGTTFSMWVDGVMVVDGLTLNTNQMTIDQFTIGTYLSPTNPILNFIGRMGEFVVYNRANTAQEIKDIQRYLGYRWIDLPLEADIMLAIGQSNMVGQGDSTTSPDVTPGIAFEARSTGEFIHLEDPLGEGFAQSSTGSLIPAFANGWYLGTDRALIVVPKGKSGTGLLAESDSGFGNWDKSQGTLYNEAVTAMNAALTAAAANTAFTLTGTYVAWHQGENDAIELGSGTPGVSGTTYQAALETMITNLNTDISGGIDHFFLFELGARTSNPTNANWTEIRDAQNAAVGNISFATNVADIAKTFPTTGRMQGDDLHYNQTGLNDLGTEGAANAVTIVTA